MLKRLDKMGRVSIPSDMRRTLGVQNGDQIELCVQDGAVVITAVVDRCVKCKQPLPKGTR